MLAVEEGREDPGRGSAGCSSNRPTLQGASEQTLKDMKERALWALEHKGLQAKGSDVPGMLMEHRGSWCGWSSVSEGQGARDEVREQQGAHQGPGGSS